MFQSQPKKYRETYFLLCRDIQTMLYTTKDEILSKEQIHNKNKEIANIKSTKKFSDSDWQKFLKTITTYWKI